MSQNSLKRQNTDIEMRDSSQNSVDEPMTKRSRQIIEYASTPGEVLIFGSGDTGQLGLGDSMLTRKRPMPMKDLDDKEIVDIVCGGMHTIAITKDGKLYSWGCNDQRALGRSGEEYEPGLVEGLDGIKIVKVVCGDSISMALTDQGKVYCWGTYRCAEGALGFSTDKEVQETPVLFEALEKHYIVDIAAGTDHCLALTDRGRVYGWGNGQQFQLGRRVIERRKRNGLRPEALALKNIKAIGTGSYHSFALSHDNELYVWGLNNYQQCGLLLSSKDGENDHYNRTIEDVITTPTIIQGLQGKGYIKSVVAGEHHSYVLMEDGTVYSFGRADSSQLGLTEDLIKKHQYIKNKDGKNEDSSQFKKAIGVPTQIPGLKDIIDISSGSNHAIVLNKEGQAYTWGFGEMYALGNGSDEDEETPILLTGQKLEGHKVLRVAAGAQHTAILADHL